MTIGTRYGRTNGGTGGMRPLQCAWQRSLVELRVVPGARHRPHIHHASRTVCLKQADEFLERAGGMPNRQHEGQRRRSWLSFSFRTRGLGIHSGQTHV